MYVFMVEHLHMLDEDRESIKTIGMYSTREQATAAVARLRQQPGFCDSPDGFYIGRWPVNQDHWIEGFATIIHSEADGVEEEQTDGPPTQGA
jgi:hypothetical protein